MTAQELVKKYHITLYNKDTQLKIPGKDAESVKRDGALEELKRRKAELIDFLKSERERKEAEAHQRVIEHDKKVAAIPGYIELRNAVYAVERWHTAFDRAMDRGDGIIPAHPDVKPDELRKEYPIAAAYEKALNYSYSSNYARAAAGREAEQKILNDPSCWETAIAEMERQWSEYVDEHIWD